MQNLPKLFHEYYINIHTKDTYSLKYSSKFRLVYKYNYYLLFLNILNL